MKTYLPQIEPRIFVRPNQGWGILNYDYDNAYPQRMLELVGQSPTAKDCWNKRAKFIAGQKFEDDETGKLVINRSGLTLNKLRIAIGRDKALFRAFGIHVNYNANYKVVELNYVSFENIRMGDTDNPVNTGKFMLYPDWGRRTWKNITKSRIKCLDPYNPDPKVIKQQIIDGGGWNNYLGQLYYFNPEIDVYPLIEADSVWEDFETEAGIKVFNNREVTTGFLPSTMLFMRSRREEADNSNADSGTYPSANTPSQLEKDLGKFQGAKSAQKIIVIEYEDDEDKPEFKPYSIQNNDKLFESTEASVEARIIKGFSVPQALVSTSNQKAGLSDPGSEKKEAIREFNDNTAIDRLEIVEALAELLKNFTQPISIEQLNIEPIPESIAEDAIGKVAGQNINELLITPIPAANKVAALMYAYGFSEADAIAIVPSDEEMEKMKPVAPAPGTPPIPDPNKPLIPEENA